MIRRILTASLLVMLLLSGCNSFRKAFSRKPKSEQEKRKSESRRRNSGDPLFDLVFSKDDRPQPLQNSSLSEREREIVDQELGASRRRSDAVMEEMRKERERSKAKQGEWVYGLKDGKLF